MRDENTPKDTIKTYSQIVIGVFVLSILVFVGWIYTVQTTILVEKRIEYGAQEREELNERLNLKIIPTVLENYSYNDSGVCIK